MWVLNKNLISTQHPQYQNPKYAPDLLIKRWSVAELFTIFENHVYTSKKILLLQEIL